ncbi:MAG: DUF488 domain-containing protein [Gammaproteobacteria bacterium]
MSIRIKRIYDPFLKADGQRVLVDRLWPRGVKKGDARLSLWMKGVAPSPELRRWFNHDPEHWQGFRKRYTRELGNKPEEIKKLNELMREDTLTLIYAARDPIHNHAKVIADYLVKHDKAYAKNK